MKVFTENCKLPIKSWCNEPEEGAIKQATNLANLPFVFKHIALMPDTHQGYGMPIGGVLATKNVIIPNAVGVDIGCGMCAIETNIKEWDKESLVNVLKQIRFNVPVGFGRHLKIKDVSLMPDMNSKISYPVIEKEFEKALFSIGTLGGGNHFIELQKNNEGNLCVMIHSGSRNLGKQVADHYNNEAKRLNAKYFSNVPPEWDLAFLPIDSEEGYHYISEMNYCVAFALANRRQMMYQCEQAIYETFKPFQKVEIGNFINIAHNYADMENHYGENVMIHRKGATLARGGTIGLIPGSQGTKSYIVIGRGNKESFESCSHGAGRKMGRKQAQRTLDIKEEIDHLNKLGVIHAIRNKDDLDEAPGSYKDIDVVMEEQKDLVHIKMILTPLAVIKG